MAEHTQKYRWPDLSPVERRYIVVDDQGRYGVAYEDSIYHPGVLFARPIGMGAEIGINNAVYMTNTAWHKQSSGVYTGVWFDYSGPTYPATIPDDALRKLVIVEDLGYIFPDRWADVALKDSDKSGHWNYGATLGRVGGKPPVVGQHANEMTVKQAYDYAKETGDSVTPRAIRHAAETGHIPGARKIGRDWLISYEGFNCYLDNRPKRGRKAQHS